MARQSERTCIGCRVPRPKDAVVRVAAAAGRVVLDYREKLPGRGAYLCPEQGCIRKAFARDALSKAMRMKVQAPDEREFITFLADAIRQKIRSLLTMAAKAGKLAAGYSAVKDSFEKGRVEGVLYAVDLSDGTREKIVDAARGVSPPEAKLFTRSEMGAMIGRELVGVVAFEDRGLSDAGFREAKRLKNLIKQDE